MSEAPIARLPTYLADSPNTQHSYAEARTQCLGRAQPAVISAALRVRQ